MVEPPSQPPPSWNSGGLKLRLHPRGGVLGERGPRVAFKSRLGGLDHQKPNAKVQGQGPPLPGASQNNCLLT